MDAKDILGLPKSFPGSQEKKPRPLKETQRKPDGISREVYALTGGMAPLIPTIEASHLKKRPAADKEKITWQWLPFTNSARTDNLQLYHWVRVVNGIPPTGDYQFAKYNKSVDVAKYTDEEYEKYLTDPEPYNMAHEMERKRALSSVLSRTKQQEIRDTEILSEAKRIMESRIASKGVENIDLPDDHTDNEITEKGTRAESPSPSSNMQPSSTTAPSAAITESASTPASLRMLRVYLRTHVLDQMVQASCSNAGPRTIKRVEQTLSDLGVHIKPKVPTKAVCAEHLELRKEILTLFNLQKQLQNREAETSATRDTSFAEAPGTPKRSYRGDADRLFVSEAVGFGGERMGKKDHKRKAPGRFVDAPPSPPQSKRPRKLKASDG